KEKKGPGSIKDFLIRLIEKEFELRKIKAFILAGGEGARLRPITESIPKAMIPVGYKPLLEYNLELLEKYGIIDVVLLIGKLGNRVMKYFGQNWNGLNLSYVSEATALDTAGAIFNAKNLITDNFLVMNSDILTNINLSSIIEFHKDKSNDCIATLCGIKVSNYYQAIGKSDEKGFYSDYGVFYTDDTSEDVNLVTKFEETPSKSQISGYINTGIYIFKPEIMDYLSDSEGKSISSDIIPKLIRDKQVKAYVCPKNVFWIDVAHPERWSKAWDVLFSGAIEI
ncbi:MAG: nucleotidyltransferase family protein, partial [Candidatus Heimdallarchaeota archaeon]|nr:nucleotidyltransferase family protein [Candidatus Heimdallarchaeota archaeon]